MLNLGFAWTNDNLWHLMDDETLSLYRERLFWAFLQISQMCAHDPLAWENYTLYTGRVCSKGLRTFFKKINLQNASYLKKRIKPKIF